MCRVRLTNTLPAWDEPITRSEAGDASDSAALFEPSDSGQSGSQSRCSSSVMSCIWSSSKGGFSTQHWEQGQGDSSGVACNPDLPLSLPSSRGQVADSHQLDPGPTEQGPTEAFQPALGFPAMEGRAPHTPGAGERGTCSLVTDLCLTPSAGDRGSGHQASHPQDRVCQSVPLRTDHQAPGSEDLEV